MNRDTVFLVCCGLAVLNAVRVWRREHPKPVVEDGSCGGLVVGPW